MSSPGGLRAGMLRFRTSDESHRVTTFELFFRAVIRARAHPGQAASEGE